MLFIAGIAGLGVVSGFISAWMARYLVPEVSRMWLYPSIVCSALLFGLFAWRLGSTSWLLLGLYLVVVGITLMLIDLAVHRLPDVLTLPSYGVVGLLVLLVSISARTGDIMIRALICGAALFAAYYLLAFLSPAAMGFGDVKLAGVLGLALGAFGWLAPLQATLAAFVLGGVLSAVLLIFRRATRHTRIPFGPFMLVGTYLVLLL